MQRILIIILLFGKFTELGSQSLKKLTLEEAVLKRGTELAPQRLQQPAFIPKKGYLTYILKNQSKKEVMVQVSTSGKLDTILTLTQINPSLKNAGYPSELTRFPIYNWISEQEILFTTNLGFYMYNMQTSESKKQYIFEKGSSGADFSYPGKRMAYIVNDHLKICGNDQQPINDLFEKEGIVLGQSVHRNEFGINKGTFFSPSGKYLAYYRMDETMVTTYPIVGTDTVPSQAKMIRYPMAGDKSHHVTVKILDVSQTNGHEITLETGEPKEQYLTNICWSPDELYIYIAVINREQNHYWLNQYNARNGKFLRTLFEEKHDKYVEPLHPMYFIGKTNQFLWQSEADGYNHLYLYNSDGKLVRQLTQGSWIITDVYGCDPAGKYIYFQSTQHGYTERHIYRVKISGGKPERLDTEPGTHQAMFSDDMSTFLDTWSSVNTPRKSVLKTNTGKEIQIILESQNPLKEYRMPTLQLFTLKNAEGTELACRLLRPSNFDSTRKYPVMVYVYGGPHAQMINNVWLGGADLWMHQLAEDGYLVFTLDNRGSDNRGRDFEQATFRRLGEIEMIDQMTGVNWLKQKSYVDSGRMAVNGWSFGGFMTTSFMFKRPGTFKVGVCGGPVIDWRMYEVMYTERYMDRPQENPEGYRISNVLNYVNQLSGNLLVIHGTADDVVVWEHSLKLVEACVKAGKQLDYFVYPGHEHNVLGADRAHLIRKMVDYMKDKLR